MKIRLLLLALAAGVASMLASGAVALGSSSSVEPTIGLDRLDAAFASTSTVRGIATFGTVPTAADVGALQALGLTKSLALEGARHGINVNAIVPGIIGSEAFHFGNPEMNERMIKRTALRRVGEPQDIANAIAFLCSDLASYITGVGLNVSGGIELFTF